MIDYENRVERRKKSKYFNGTEYVKVIINGKELNGKKNDFIEGKKEKMISIEEYIKSLMEVKK